MIRSRVFSAPACVLLGAAVGCGTVVVASSSGGGASSTVTTGSPGGASSTVTTSSQGGASSTATTTGAEGGASSTASTGGGGCGGAEAACDGGCTTLSTDPENCGACGNVCEAPLQEQCVEGVCVPFCDEPGFAVCGDVCTNLQHDFQNCGACGNVCCPASWGCDSGMCAGGCPKGHLNCSGDYCADGCDVELGTPENCEGCGDTCAAPNATTTCDTTNGPPACELVSCSPGYADCDAMEADGCEVDTTTDPGNCGACGHACMAGQSCVGGACQ